jgi:hypothetical protein
MRSSIFLTKENTAMITTTQPPSKRGRWWRLGSVASLVLGALLVAAIVTPSFSRGVDQLQMLLPTAGAIFKPGDQLKIQWSYQDSPQPFPVTLYLARTDAGATDRFEIGGNLQPDPAATTTFDWFIPNNIPAGRYIVTASNFNASVQQSTGIFSIVALPQSTQIRVLYPPRAAGPPLSAFGRSLPGCLLQHDPARVAAARRRSPARSGRRLAPRRPLRLDRRRAAQPGAAERAV